MNNNKNIIFIGKTNSLGGFMIFYEIPLVEIEDDFEVEELIKFKPIEINGQRLV